MKADILVSVVAIIRDPVSILPEFIRETLTLLQQNFNNYELILIDNRYGSTIPHVVLELLGQYRCIRYLQLTRPASEETGLIAGLDAAIGDYVAVLNPDTDSPEVMLAMIDRCRSDADYVQGIHEQPPATSWAYSLSRSLFVHISRRLLGVEQPVDRSEMMVFSRQAVNALVKIRVRKRYLNILAANVGLRMVLHPHSSRSRSGCTHKIGLLKAFRAGLSIIIHNSTVPLRAVSILGIIGSSLSFMYSLYVTTIYFVKADVMPGWTTLSLALSGLFALAFIMLALMGEYMARLLDEVSDRPLYHIREELSSAVMLAEPERRNVSSQSL